MRILILGGTRFVGRHIATTLLAAGHRVTILTRGRSADPLPASVERLRGDRDAGAAGLAALGRRAWDACIDVSGYTARQVRPSAERLRDRVGRYVFISAVSVYGAPTARPVVETQPRLTPAPETQTDLAGEMYGRLKVTCENIVHDIYGPRATLLRPQVVIGPQDPSGRFVFWLERARRVGPMLAPGDGGDYVQTIDVRDVAGFAARVVAEDLSGAFNLAGPRLPWREFLPLLGAQRLCWVPAALLAEAGLTYRELPLYRPEHGPRAGLMDVSSARARAAGLTLTDPAVTAADTVAWCEMVGWAATTPAELRAEWLTPSAAARLMRQAGC